MKIAFVRPNLASASFRGIVGALHDRGHEVTFIEPQANGEESRERAERALEQARDADLIVKVSGTGAFDEFLERGALAYKRPGSAVVYWDTDPLATVTRVENDPNDPLRIRVPDYDAVVISGGSGRTVDAYQRLGARLCLPIYPAFDPSVHFPCASEARFTADLGYLGDRSPYREAQIEELFLRTASLCPDGTFVLGGNGWEGFSLPSNVRCTGPLTGADHNAFHCTPKCVLEVSDEGRFAPTSRMFEIAGAAACLITDRWEGVERFFEPGVEIIVADRGEDVAEIVTNITPRRARTIGQAAYYRALAEHTYAHRVAELEEVLTGSRPPKAVAL